MTPVPALTLKRVNFVSPLTSLVLFKLPRTGVQSKWVCEQAICTGPSGGRSGTAADLCLTQVQSMLVFTASCYRDFSSRHLCPGLGVWLWSWDPCASLGGPLEPTYTSWCLTDTRWVWNLPILPLLLVSLWFLLCVFHYRTFVQLVLGWLSMMAFL